MSEAKIISPLLDGFALGDPISEHDGVRCCPAIKENSDNKYIVKIIAIPASQTQMDALLLAGAYKDPEGAMEYYRELSDDVLEEAQFLKNLSRLEGFEPYEGWQMEPITKRRLGYEVYLLGTYKKTLEKHVSRNPMTHLEAVNLGLDLCEALSVCRQAGALYVDLKPSNIFLTEKKEYRIGDLGFVLMDALGYTSLPAKYRSCYTAPELHDPMASINLTADTYALGMILYQLYNEGALPFRDKAPEEVLPSPVNADYELAEIIMKAIHPDPQQRWQDPKEMGQALVSYMQRNVVNDVPITPYTPIDTEAQGVQIPREPEAEEPVPDAAAEAVMPETEPEQAESAADEVSAAPDEDAQSTEAPPEQETEEEPVREPEVSSELTQILEKADALAAHELPGSVVIPQIPDAPDPFAFATEDSVEAQDLTVPIDPIMDPEPEAPKKKQKAKKKFLSPDRKRKVRKIFSTVLALILLAVLACGAFWYYQNLYLQKVDSLTVEGRQDSLTVSVKSQADESLLTVTCSDSYGNTKTQEVSGGKAVFKGLTPNTMYTIQLDIDGFHDLIGQTSDIFTTSTTTEILSFTAITGQDDGTVILSFSVDGEEPREWTVRYSTEGGEEKAKTFLGHSVALSSLDIGKVYTFTLDAGTKLSLSGKTSVEFMSSRLILAEDLTASTNDGTDMVIRWKSPGDTVVDSWNVRCYNSSGYDETLAVTDTEVHLTNIDPTHSYAIEVTASGMTQPARTSITAHPINITALNVDENRHDQLGVSWEFAGAEPEGGWLLMYSIDGSSSLSVVKCSKSSAVISPRIPDADYTFTIQSADGTSIFSNVHSYSCPEGPDYNQNEITADNITAYLLKTPEDPNWNYDRVGRDAFTDQFTLGDRMSIVLHGNKDFYLPGNELDILYVVQDTHGNVLPQFTCEGHDYWKQIWNGGNYHYGELDIPSSPAKAGSYILKIYFNGDFIAETPFTVSE